MSKLKASFIHLPISLKQEDLERKLNELIKDQVYEDTNIDDDGLMLIAKKSETIRLDINPPHIRYRVPLDIWLKKDLGLTTVEGTGIIAIELSSSYEITGDWEIKTKTKVLNHEWLVKPKVKLGVFKLPIKFIADKLMERSETLIGQTLDQQLAKQFNLRDYVQKAWDILNKPMQISADLDLWMRVQPNNLSMMPLENRDGLLSSMISIQAFTGVQLGQVEDKEAIGAMPPFQYSDTENHTASSLQLNAKASYQKIEMLIARFVVGKDYSVGGQTIKLEQLKLSGQVDHLNIEASLSGTFNGKAFVKGQPFYNKTTHQLKLRNLDLVLETDDLLMRGIVWLFQKRLKNELEKAMNVSLLPYLEQGKLEIQKYLKNYPLTEQIFLNGQLDEMELDYITLTAKEIKAALLFEGKLELQIKTKLLS